MKKADIVLEKSKNFDELIINCCREGSLVNKRSSIMTCYFSDNSKIDLDFETEEYWTRKCANFPVNFKGDLVF